MIPRGFPLFIIRPDLLSGLDSCLGFVSNTYCEHSGIKVCKPYRNHTLGVPFALCERASDTVTGEIGLDSVGNLNLKDSVSWIQRKWLLNKTSKTTLSKYFQGWDIRDISRCWPVCWHWPRAPMGMSGSFTLGPAVRIMNGPRRRFTSAQSSV